MDIKKRDLPRSYRNKTLAIERAGNFHGFGNAPHWTYRHESEAVPGSDNGEYVEPRKPRRNQWKFKVRKSSGETKVMTASKVYRDECPEDKPQPVRKVTSATTDDRGQRDYWNAGVKSQFKSLV